MLAMNANGTADPYVKLYLLPDVTKQTKKKTAVHKGTRNPIFNEQFTWEIRTGTDLESKRLHISVWDDQTWKRNQFMGAMSFSLAEIADPETLCNGWFKLLDEKKGEFQSIPYRPKRLADAAAGKGPADKAKGRYHNCLQAGIIFLLLILFFLVLVLTCLYAFLSGDSPSCGAQAADRQVGKSMNERFIVQTR